MAVRTAPRGGAEAFMMEIAASYHPGRAADGAVQCPPVLDRPRAPLLSAGVSRIAVALTYRDFRVLWTGAFASSIGTWMQKVAQSWLVLTISGSASAFYLG